MFLTFSLIYIFFLINNFKVNFFEMKKQSKIQVLEDQINLELESFNKIIKRESETQLNDDTDLLPSKKEKKFHLNFKYSNLVEISKSKKFYNVLFSLSK